MARIVHRKPAARSRTECSEPRTPRDIQHEYVRRLDALDFHVNALRYRSGLPHSLNAEEQELVQYARQAVNNGLLTDAGADQWAEVWGRYPTPMLLQAVAVELQALQAA